MDGVCIIAEAGVNHNGNFDTAQEMVRVAKRGGADMVKFQTFQPDALASQYAAKAPYQKQNTGTSQSQVEMLGRLAFSQKQYAALREYCASQQIQFLTTPFDIPSVRMLCALDIPAIKIPSGEITNLPYLIEIGKLAKPVLLSTGMSTLEEVGAAIKVLQKEGTQDITLLHCNTQYPTPFIDANLLAMRTLQEAFGLPVGYSDHTPGIEASVAAVALGAVVIEKHFTLDKTMDGPDHKASLEPDELCALAVAIRNVEQAMGDGVKRVTASERENMDVARKSIVAACDIPAGEAFTEENITTKRPGNGISPMRWFEVLGKAAPRDFAYDELIELGE